MSRFQRPYWQDAYDAQMALWRWYRTDRGPRWLAGIYRAIVGSVPTQFPTQFRRPLAQMFDAELGKLIDCDPIYVSADMCALVAAAEGSFLPEPLHPYDLPTTRGFLFYAEPFEIFDKHGIGLTARALSWCQSYRAAEGVEEEALVAKIAETIEAGAPVYGDRFRTTEMDALVADGYLEASGIEITLYSDRDPYIEISSRRHAGESEREYDRTMAETKRLTAGVPILPIHLAPWHYGQSFDGNEIDVNGEQTGAEQWWRLAQTTFRLMMQKKPRAGYGRPYRAVRREAARLGFPPETEILIVRLRKEENPRPEDSEPSGRTLTHRHLRTGHWRNQWYPSERIHRQIYIDPTVVGDESLPLLVRPRRVFQWTR